ncbi:MAG: 50S ribosomal protein L6 [Candidatus Buchananbacteria bacterium]
MSRIGKKIINIPDGVDFKIEDGFALVKGPKGLLKQEIHPQVHVNINDKEVSIKVDDETIKSQRSLWGLFGSLLTNMVEGVTKGFEKKLEINGVGMRAAVSGNKLVLNVGFSHPVEYLIPQGIQMTVEANVITVSGIDKQMVGEAAAQIRKIKKVEPYKGKGIRYQGEQVRRKAGKAAAKSK